MTALILDIPFYHDSCWNRRSIEVHSPGLDVIRLTHHYPVEALRNSYKHRSPNPSEFEIRCLERWFLFRDYCRQKGIDRFVTMDTDVLVFCDLVAEAERYADFDFTVTEDRGMCASGLSFVNKLAVLERFCENVMAFYQHGVMDRPYDNISDMVFWSQLVRSGSFGWSIASIPREGCAYDNNLCSTDGWKEENGAKVLEWQDGHPFGFWKGRRVRLLNLHCWGPWKSRMAELWKQSLNSIGQNSTAAKTLATS